MVVEFVATRSQSWLKSGFLSIGPALAEQSVQSTTSGFRGQKPHGLSGW